jgi:general secretion pathway protein I
MSDRIVRHTHGFTLIEVLVALVIVAFGMSAVLAALSSSAENISALREKNLAEWIALNQIADARLIATSPQPGVLEGDVKAFGNADWHWRRDIIAVDMIPGMLEIAVRVRRMTPGSTETNHSGSSTTTQTKRLSSTSSGAIGSFFGSSGGSSGAGSSGRGSSGGGSSSGSGELGAASDAVRKLGATNLPTSGDEPQWVATVIGFRGDSIGPPSGEAPDFGACVGTATAASQGPCASSSSSGASSNSGSGTATNAVIEPGNSTTPGVPTPPATGVN